MFLALGLADLAGRQKIKEKENSMFGMIEINGKRFIERQQTFTTTVSITTNNQLLLNQSVVLPGVADFLLKARVRQVIKSNVDSDRRFRYREGNTDGAVWYMSAGTGNTNDRVLDPLVFGTGQFPFPVVPGIFFSKSASILFDVEDVSADAPYTIYIAWIGSYLIPVAN